ncbi:YrhB domain-containing protein [Amycolatopsis sp. FDAARGOS 1241]|uniref:YrhB domain-containing protein n=1 Tax=Amycolatopsis sp. FDAARGOS 1241 TaxID=2778070 RepID=UPI00194FE8B0|nr:YrhB domain-containing protein [Amycolatopsis sp. FDAARGOS 1241]QRP49259.1 hypothetical protein I6J71_16690 [Amycolatopsis sp. FDAARGOS 1241]
MDRDNALAAARALLDQETAAIPEDSPFHDMVIRDEQVVQHPAGWLVPFNTRRYLETEDFAVAAVPNLVMVPGDGSPAHFPPSAVPVDRYLEAVTAGEIGWGQLPQT